ncbi:MULTISPECIES: ArsR/SmtB family transcription factor [Bacillaceae]|uniref:Winged helix-turn-helix transcriptional regulator n=1 Tax=Sutcliffiella horikoshii TaxID=79883 RepID=A0A5D4SZQ3_9BACI|nr:MULTISPECIES: metalloregulator ArsR/SmtB family transcription factor [Bacillaceae]TYS67326.1 winged helix-turn-helix transcriptional regulator [Sutcliffiella horikoshii]
MVNYNDENLDDIFYVLSDPTRRAIIQELSKGEKTTKKLAEPFDMSLPAISKHMKVLETAGLVSYNKVGRYKYYSLQSKAIEDASNWLSDLKSFWEAQFTSLEKFLLNEKGESKE